MSDLARLIIASFAFLCAWLSTAAAEALRSPDWATIVGGALIVVSVAAVVKTLHRWTQAGDRCETEPGGDDGEGGPRCHWPDGPPPGGGGSAPSWWPEFEHRLASYIAERERDRCCVRTRSRVEQTSRPRTPA